MNLEVLSTNPNATQQILMSYRRIKTPELTELQVCELIALDLNYKFVYKEEVYYNLFTTSERILYCFEDE